MLCCVLVSGGKDSGHCLSLLPSLGHTAVCLANLTPAASEVDELDSMMFQTAGHRAVGLYSALTGLPLYRKRTDGRARDQGLAYGEGVGEKEEEAVEGGDEVEDLFALLEGVKARHPEVEAVVSGAILSDYQRLRVEACCARLGVTSVAPLWRRDQGELLDEMIAAGLRAVLLKVACFGLEPRKHLGLELGEARAHLHELHAQVGCHICGEGGEYETLVLAGPCFHDGRTLELLEKKVVEPRPGDGVGWIAVRRCRAVDAEGNDISDQGRVVYIDDDDDSGGEKLCSEGAVAVDEVTLGGLLNADSGDFDFDVAERVFANGAFVAVTPSRARGAVDGVAQFGAMLACLEEALDELGFDVGAKGARSSLQCVAFVALYVHDMAGYAVINAEYVRRFNRPNPPSRLCVQVAGLPKGAAVALECLAFAPEAVPRRTLHVQSVSTWATACIGPYAQANVLGDRLALLAGAIPLDPPTMQPVTDGLIAQAALCARNVAAVAAAVAGQRPTRPVACTVFSTSASGIHAAADALAPARVTLGIIVPALPRGVDIEVRPILLLEDAPGQETDDYDDDHDNDDVDDGHNDGGLDEVSRANQPWRLETVPATCEFNAGEWLVHARGIVARGRLLRLTLSVVAHPTGGNAASASAMCADLAARALADAGLATGHILSISGHHARDPTGPASLAQTMDEAFAALGLGCVSVQPASDIVHLGIDVPRSLRDGPTLAVDLVAWRHRRPHLAH